jgi:altronate dehydratase small subunit
MADRAVVLHPADNVATALADLSAGEVVGAGAVPCTLVEAVPFGHKVALRPIAADGPVIKYGEQIGLARGPIRAGECVHIHNVESQRGRGDRVTGDAR